MIYHLGLLLDNQNSGIDLKYRIEKKIISFGRDPQRLLSITEFILEQ